MRELVNLLGFLGALKNYGYIDRVGNAIDELTISEALRDAIRAYITHCGEDVEKCIEISESEGVKCLGLNPEELKRLVEIAIAEMKKSKIEMLKFSRHLALRAYAAIPVIRIQQKCTPSK